MHIAASRPEENKRQADMRWHSADAHRRLLSAILSKQPDSGNGRLLLLPGIWAAT